MGVRRSRSTMSGCVGPDFLVEADVYKVITVGGSTTECLYLDDSETWPQLLMDSTNSRQQAISVWVGNAGRSGRTTVDHLASLRSLPILIEADMLIFQIGINDLSSSLALEGAPTQRALERNLGLGGLYSYPTFKRLRLFQFGRNALSKIDPSLVYVGWQITGSELVHLRRQRAQASIVPLPDLQTGLQEYKQRVRNLALECRARGIRCLFTTQPSMWRSDLSPFEEELLVFGWIGPRARSKGYVSTAELAKAMDAYNDALLDVCRQEGLECYDVASAVPKDVSAFYDDVRWYPKTRQLAKRESSS